MEYKDYPCVVDESFCLNKQVNMWSCHGSTGRLECYANWGSTDPEDVEPYEEYVAELKATGRFHG